MGGDNDIAVLQTREAQTARFPQRRRRRLRGGVVPYVLVDGGGRKMTPARVGQVEGEVLGVEDPSPPVLG